MASNYSTDLKLELMVTGENAGTWGDNTNNNLNLIQQAVAGFESIALNNGGNVALAMTDKAISTARNMVIKFTGSLTGASTVTVPDTIEKFYIFDCSAVGGPTNLTIKTASGSGFTLDAAKIYAAYTDGTNLNEISLDTLGGTVAAANITGTISTAQIADDAVTSAKIADDAVVAAAIADNAVVTAAINADAVTQAKIADDAVGPDQLADTAVTAASYTVASITVDAQGRITAASSGSAGGGSYVLTDLINSASTSTFTANPATTHLHVFGIGSGGGCGTQPNAPQALPGGNGSFGFAEVAITQPYAVPIRVGSPGVGGSGVQGTPGQSSFIDSDVVFGGGNGGMSGSSGNSNGNNVSSNGTLFFDETGNSDSVRYQHIDPQNARKYGDGAVRNVSSTGKQGILEIYQNIGS